jgi:hypothetical protein
MNPVIIALIVLLVVLLILRFKSSYTKPAYTPKMTIEEVTAEYMRATKEMSEEHLAELNNETDEAKKALLMKKFEAESDAMSQEMQKITADLHQKRPDTCPPCPACGVKDVDAAKPSKTTASAGPIDISEKVEKPVVSAAPKPQTAPVPVRVAPEPQTAEVTAQKSLAPV